MADLSVLILTSSCSYFKSSCNVQRRRYLILTSSCYYFKSSCNVQRRRYLISTSSCVADKIAFRILSNTWEVFRSIRDSTLISVSFDKPPITSMMILYWFTSYLCIAPSVPTLTDHTSKSFLYSFSLGWWSMGNSLISMVMTFLFLWFTTLASTR